MFRMDTACSSLPSLFGGQGSWLSSAKNGGALARSKHNVSIEQLLTIFKSRADVWNVVRLYFQNFRVQQGRDLSLWGGLCRPFPLSAASEQDTDPVHGSWACSQCPTNSSCIAVVLLLIIPKEGPEVKMKIWLITRQDRDWPWGLPLFFARLWCLYCMQFFLGLKLSLWPTLFFFRFGMFWDVGWNNVALRQICLSPEPVLEPSVAAEEPRPLYALEGCEGCAQSGSSFVHSAISLPWQENEGRIGQNCCFVSYVWFSHLELDWVLEFIGLGREEPCCWFQLFDATL